VVLHKHIGKYLCVERLLTREIISGVPKVDLGEFVKINK